MSDVATLSRELRTIRTSFRQLAAAFSRITPILTKRAPVSSNGTGPARRKRRITASHRAALKLQGRYMGTLRGLKPRLRSKVKKVRAAKGIQAAIAAARRPVRGRRETTSLPSMFAANVLSGLHYLST